MSTSRRRVAIGVAAVTGAVVGVVTTMALSAPRRPAPAAGGSPRTSVPARDVAPTTTTTAPAGREATLLVWTSAGLPPGLGDRVERLDGVQSVTVVQGDQAALLRSVDDAGQVVDAVAGGWQIPLDTLAVDPATLAPFLKEPATQAVAGLEPGEGLLTETSARLRRLSAGATLELTTGSITVAGVIDDISGAGAELLVHAADAGALGVATERYLLIAHIADRTALQQAIAGDLGGTAVRFRTPAETVWLRHGDAVAPMAMLKSIYGEFTFREQTGRDVQVDPAWVDKWIVTDTVPVLGAVTCHRRVIESLRAAMADLERAGLAHLVDPAAYAGCYSPRRIAAGQPLSHHAWGAAADLNVIANPRGSFSTQDLRLVDTMRRHGWTWGGTWLVPDPAHYEAPMEEAASALSQPSGAA